MDERLRDRVKAAVLDPKWVYAVLLTAAMVTAAQQVLLGPHVFEGKAYTNYNNYIIYKQAFLHLVQGQELYARYPAEHGDMFRYSPTFAALMAPFAFLPNVVGLILWNLLNAAVFVLAIRRLPVLDDRGKALLSWFLLPEFVTSVQNCQCNVLVAGLLILAFGLLEGERSGWAALAIVASFYIKIFGLLAAALFLLYPGKKRFLFSAAGWLVLLGAIPLLFVSTDQLGSLYRSWLQMLSADHPPEIRPSVMGWLRSWFGIDPPRLSVVLVGVTLSLLPLLRVREYAQASFRAHFFALLLISMILLNYRSESATFIVALCGVALWYFSQARSPVNLALLAFAFLLTSMSPRFPRVLLERFVAPYALKAVPCLLIWVTIVWNLISSGYRSKTLTESNP